MGTAQCAADWFEEPAPIIEEEHADPEPWGGAQGDGDDAMDDEVPLIPGRTAGADPDELTPGDCDCDVNDDAPGSSTALTLLGLLLFRRRRRI